VLTDRLSDDSGIYKDFKSTTYLPQRTDVTIEPIDSKSVKDRLYIIQKGICNGCGNEYLKKDLQTDHIISRKKGGGDYFENYQLLCGNCNQIKYIYPMAYLRMKIDAREKVLKEEIIFGEEDEDTPLC